MSDEILAALKITICLPFYTANLNLPCEKRSIMYLEPLLSVDSMFWISAVTIHFSISRSPMTNITFKVMMEYLNDICKVCEQYRCRNSIGPSTPLLPHVKLTTLLIDVAGLTRHKSEFRLYPSHHYTLNRHSKSVIIDVRPSHNCSSEGNTE